MIKKKRERNDLYIPNYRRLVASLFVGPIRTCIYANNGIIAGKIIKYSESTINA